VSRGPVVRGLLCAIACALLLFLAWWMIKGGLNDVRQASDLGQQAETVVRFACGLLSVAAVVTRFRWRRRARTVRIAWMVSLAGMVGLSALVWGPPMPHVALLFVAAALLLAWALLWTLGPASAA